MPEKECVFVEYRAETAVVHLNRPEVMNAMNVDMAVGLRAAFTDIGKAKGLRAVLVRGEGKSFCAGGDVAGFKENLVHIDEHVETLVPPLHAAILLFASLPIPTVAMLQGAVAGAGLGLAMAADFAVAGDNAKFTMAYSRIGTSPDSASSWLLPRLVGMRKAKELAFFSDLLNAQEALRLGLVNRVVPRGDLEKETEALLAQLVAGPTQAYGRIKKLLNLAETSDIEAQLNAEYQEFKQSVQTQDFSEGVTAFVEKRAATYTGS